MGIKILAISYRGRPALVTQTKSETETEVPGTHDSQVQPVLSRLPVADSIYMTHSQMLGKFEYTRGPIFKVVLEC